MAKHKCEYTSRFLVVRNADSMSVWGKPSPVKLDAGDIVVHISQAMDETITTTIKRPRTSEMFGGRYFEIQWNKSSVKSISVTIPTLYDLDRIQAGKVEADDLARLNEEATSALLGKHPTPSAVEEKFSKPK
jgi:hypothetical protein